MVGGEVSSKNYFSFLCKNVCERDWTEMSLLLGSEVRLHKESIKFSFRLNTFIDLLIKSPLLFMTHS